MANNEEKKSMSMDDIEARVEAILANAQKKADQIISNASKSAKSTEKTNVNGFNPKDYAHEEEYVTIRLFKDKNKYKDDVYVSVNGENCQIQRGKDVRIKRKFANVLEQSLRQDEFAAMYSETLQNDYSEREKAGKL